MKSDRKHLNFLDKFKKEMKHKTRWDAAHHVISSWYTFDVEFVEFCYSYLEKRSKPK